MILSLQKERVLCIRVNV